MKSKKALVIVVIVAILFDWLILNKVPVVIPDNVTVSVDMESTNAGNYQFFYSDGIFDINNCKTVEYKEAGKRENLKFEVPSKFNSWRIDFGEETAEVKIYSIHVSYHGNTWELKDQLLLKDNQFKGVDSISEESGTILIQTNSDDPQCIFAFSQDYIRKNLENLAQKWCDILNIIICVAFDIILLAAGLIGRKIVSLLQELWSSRKLVMNLAQNDFKTKYVGSYLGIIWAFIQPLVTILVYWFVFQVGLRSGDVGNFPFILWLMAGLVPWFFFSDALSAGTTSLLEYQYLVKKIVFKISVLPAVKIISAMYVHIAFMALTVIIYAFYGYTPDWHTLQIIYYTFCTAVLSLALVYFTCSIVIFFRDTTQIVGIFLQIGMWMTPIMWQIAILPTQFLWIFKAMPMYYVVAGYRDSLIDKVWFWERPYETAWFWGFTLVLFALGTVVFKKLKVHFADVL